MLNSKASSLILDPNSPYHCLVNYPAGTRNIVLYGGRGSAKSWSVAEAIVRKMANSCVRVLCCREIQNSIKDSSHKLLKDTIWRLGLQNFFVVTNDSIKSRTGSECIFKGLFNNENGIRSTEGIDICWVEEAHSVSESSWRSLTPTIRQAGSMLWITFNLMDETDPVYVRFVARERRNTIVKKVNYDANPFFWNSPLAEEMEEDKRADYTMYEHIWLGMPLRLDNSIVYSGKYREEAFPDDLWQQAPRLHFGLDFGFSQDPAACLRMFILDRKLYISHEAYGTGVELDEYDQFLQDMPGVREWPIKADSSAPATISHIRNKFGFQVEGAEKWEGCIKDGVRHIRQYDEIVVHPRCVNTLLEFRRYRYKVDRITKEVLPIIIDKNNHAMDAIRYGLDGHIQRGGDLAIWDTLGTAPGADPARIDYEGRNPHYY